MVVKSGTDATTEKRRTSPLRVGILAALVVLLGGWVVRGVATNHAPGCSSYREVDGRYLIAHAGGGLPDRMYPNNIAALDHSYANGLRSFEMDFHQLPFGLVRAGHDTSDLFDPRGAWLSDVLDWLRRHPDARLVVDMKTDNVAGLKRFAAAATEPALRQRIVPYVYHKEQYEAVRKLGFYPPIYAQFQGEDPGWLDYANSREFSAVALSPERLQTSPDLRHPIIIFTYDGLDKTEGAGAIITNCMIPKGRTPYRPAGVGDAPRIEALREQARQEAAAQAEKE